MYCLTDVDDSQEFRHTLEAMRIVGLQQPDVEAGGCGCRQLVGGLAGGQVCERVCGCEGMNTEVMASSCYSVVNHACSRR